MSKDIELNAIREKSSDRLRKSAVSLVIANLGGPIIFLLYRLGHVKPSVCSSPFPLESWKRSSGGIGRQEAPQIGLVI